MSIYEKNFSELTEEERRGWEESLEPKSGICGECEWFSRAAKTMAGVCRASSQDFLVIADSACSNRRFSAIHQTTPDLRN